MGGDAADSPGAAGFESFAEPEFFGVPPAYFFDDQVTATVNAELNLLVALRDTQVQHVALRTAGLSHKSLRSISEMIERVRELEGLAPEPGTPDQ
ncbi:hypothetical protein OG730_21085 [Streptomyces sp. NBC_01298]|uniref:hypothetical protein n=1 Tax=Streptomyces sp. NBC_01298 TaxID=2903817 RepID=UPI002E15FEB3|nr:hypothetical protein OG730_21085 [Streptomyces sp. NBC_01298]